MEFEWDEAKRQEILGKRGLDLLEMALIFDNAAELELYEDPRHAGEKRVTALGCSEGVWYCVVYEDKGAVLRLITGWRLNEKSKRKHQARLARRIARNEGER